MASEVWSRRRLLQTGAALAATGLGGALVAPLFREVGYRPPTLTAPPPGPRYRGPQPNILLIVVDDLAADVVGARSRFPFLQTPHIGQLEREGVAFARSFVPTSVCSPSRASLLTGSYPHQHGVLINDVNDLTGDLPNFPSLLKGAGYETGFVGKWHMNTALDGPRLDFDTWLSFSGQGVYQNPTLNENGRRFVQRGYTTDILSDYAARWLQRPRSGPFCLIVSHKAAHVPFTAAARHRLAFAGARLPEPPSFRDTLAGKPAWQRRYKLCGLGPDSWNLCEDTEIPAELPLEAWNSQDHELLTYLRTLLAVDDSVGLLREALASVGQLDNTLVVFTSDNGFLLGAHRLADKRLMYEESIRVPLLLRYPARIAPRALGRGPDGLVSSLDLAPTILELAGVPVPASMQGRSLWPLLESEPGGAGVPWRSALLYEYFREYGPGVPTMVGVRGERWKYVTYPELEGDISELYDLVSDPFELHNLIDERTARGALERVQELLAAQLEATGYAAAMARLGVPASVPPNIPLTDPTGGHVGS